MVSRRALHRRDTPLLGVFEEYFVIEASLPRCEHHAQIEEAEWHCEF